MDTIEEALRSCDKESIYYIKKNPDGSLSLVFYSKRFNPKNPINIKKAMNYMTILQSDPDIIGSITNNIFTPITDILTQVEKLKENADFRNRIKKRFERRLTKREMKVYRK